MEHQQKLITPPHDSRRWYVEIVAHSVDIQILLRSFSSDPAILPLENDENNKDTYHNEAFALLTWSGWNDDNDIFSIFSSASYILAELSMTVGTFHDSYNGASLSGRSYDRLNDEASRTYMATSRSDFRLNTWGMGFDFGNGKIFNPPYFDYCTFENFLHSLADCPQELKWSMMALSSRPLNYFYVFIAYETIRTFFCGKSRPTRIIEMGWANEAELESLYRTGQHHRHGLPRKPLTVPEMPLVEAAWLVRRLIINWINLIASEKIYTETPKSS